MTGAGSALGGEEASGLQAATAAMTGATSAAPGPGDANESEQRHVQRQKQSITPKSVRLCDSET